MLIEISDIYFYHFLLIVFCFVLLMSPSSLFVNKVISLKTGFLNRTKFNIHDEGTIIGVLERYLIFILMIFNHFESIGLIIAAKTMVRYGQFDDSFRSKYLIGTLTSTLSVFLVYSFYVVSTRLLF